MTASNPCCKECFLPERDGPTFYSHAAGYALPEGCKDEECECHKENPAAKCTCGEPSPDTIVEHRYGGLPCRLWPIKDTPAAIEKRDWSADKCNGAHCKCMNLGGQCLNRHYADCHEHNHSLSKPQPAKEWWEDTLEKIWNRAHIPEYANDAKIPLRGLMKDIAAQSEKKGRGDAVDFIMRESMIEPDFSPHADYIIPFKVLEAARSSEEGKTNNK